MTIRQAIASFLQLFVLFVFFSISLFFICLAYLPKIRILIEDLLLNHSDACLSIGIVFFIASFLLAVGFYGLNKGRTLHIKMGRNSAEIDSQIIRQTIEEHFKGRFNGIRILDVEIIRNAKMNIFVAFKQMPDNVDQWLGDFENELIPLLKSRFGYTKPIELLAETRSNA
jgi:hypothetical protein